MNTPAIISRILAASKFCGKDGNPRIRHTIELKVPYLTHSGTLSYDFIIGDYYTPDTPTATAEVQALVGRDMRAIYYFDVRTYDNPAKGTQYFQNCYISKLYDNESRN